MNLFKKIFVYNVGFKYLILCGVALVLTTVTNAQNNDPFEDYYASFSDVPSPTGFLLNMGFFTEQSIEPFIISAEEDISDRFVFADGYLWYSWYQKLRISQREWSTLLPPVEDLGIPENTQNNTVIPIGILFVDGDYVLADSLVVYENPDTTIHYVDPAVPTTVQNVFAVSPLLSEVNDREVTFEIRSDLIFTNRQEELLYVEIDFGDGNGFLTFPLETANIEILYPSGGTKSIISKLITANDTLTCFSNIVVNTFDFPTPDEQGVLNVELPNGDFSKGEFMVLYGCDGVLDRPIILVEGFDPYQNRQTGEIYDKYRHFFSVAQQKGWDIVLLRFVNNNDFIQNNARVLRSLLNEVNTRKNGHIENILIGESMGGLVSRICLSQMEEAGENHEVRLYTSFDSPHQGANMPLSIQELADDILDINLVELLYPVVGSALDILNLVSFGTAANSPIGNNWSEIPTVIREMYNSPAAKQMLLRHRAYKHTIAMEYLEFQDLLSFYGFPGNSRNVALINGSNQARQQYRPNGQKLEIEGERYIDVDWDIGWLGSGITIYANVSDTNVVNAKISRIRIRALFLPTTNKKGRASFFSEPYDIAPGGYQHFGNKIGFCFVPTGSSTALIDPIFHGLGGQFYFNENAGDFLQSRRGMVESGLTPFDDIYANSFNTSHVNLGAIATLFNGYIEKELMFDNFYQQARHFSLGQEVDLYASNLLVIGESTNHWPSKIIEDGIVKVEEGAVVLAQSAESIHLTPGFSVQEGGQFHALVSSLASGCSAPVQAGLRQDSLLVDLFIPRPSISKKFDEESRDVQFQITNLILECDEKEVEWLLEGDGIIEKGNGAEFTVNSLPAGQYAITCSVLQGARVSSDIFSIKPTQEIESSTIPELETETISGTLPIVYPNPTSGICTIEVNETITTPVDVSITDEAGTILFTRKYPYAAASGVKFQVDLSDLSSGVYNLVLVFNGKRETLPVVVIP